MFPKNRINIVYRLLCLISYVIVLYFVNSYNTLLILFIVYCFFALCEKSFRNIELIILSVVILGICYLLDNYVLFKIMLMIDYIIYFLDTTTDVIKKERVNKRDYIRFKKNEEKGSNNLLAVYLTVHLVILFLAIMVGK